MVSAAAHAQQSESDAQDSPPYKSEAGRRFRNRNASLVVFSWWLRLIFVIVTFSLLVPLCILFLQISGTTFYATMLMLQCVFLSASRLHIREFRVPLLKQDMGSLCLGSN
ncbi:hypothetical protein ILYODFUR_032872 [Ilyodon furcidens]|uniref:Uncharacterized protein n=1 Tax=Ilyodon furcidens TaxID=33524 RepID=A0ABV0UCB2_9TELE